MAVAQSGTVAERPATEAAATGVSASSDASFNAGRWGMISMIAGGALVVGGISMGAVASQTSGNLDTCRSNPACNRTDRVRDRQRCSKPGFGRGYLVGNGISGGGHGRRALFLSR